MNNKQLALAPPPHLLKGPEPNHQNPLLVQLVEICDYFTNEKTVHDNDYYQRQKHFNDLLKAISSSDTQLSVQLIEEGKTKFGATRVMGRKLNIWRSERYYTLLVSLYDAKVLTASNFKMMPKDLKGSELEKYLNNNYFWGSSSLFSAKDKAPVTYDDAVFLSNKFLDFYSIPEDYVPLPSLPPAELPEAQEPGQLLPVNRVNSTLSEQAQRKMRGMSDLEREMCELSQDTLRNEYERQQVAKKWEEFQKKVQSKNLLAAPVAPLYPVTPPAEEFQPVIPAQQYNYPRANNNGYVPPEAVEAPSSQNPQASLPQGFFGCVMPVQHLQPVVLPADAGIQWTPMTHHL